MNKRERMKALFSNEETDYVPAGFWFHYPADYTVEQHLEGHLKLFRETDQDIIKLMDDNFGNLRGFPLIKLLIGGILSCRAGIVYIFRGWRNWSGRPLIRQARKP